MKLIVNGRYFLAFSAMLLLVSSLICGASKQMDVWLGMVVGFAASLVIMVCLHRIN